MTNVAYKFSKKLASEQSTNNTPLLVTLAGTTSLVSFSKIKTVHRFISIPSNQLVKHHALCTAPNKELLLDSAKSTSMVMLIILEESRNSTTGSRINSKPDYSSKVLVSTTISQEVMENPSFKLNILLLTTSKWLLFWVKVSLTSRQQSVSQLQD